MYIPDENSRTESTPNVLLFGLPDGLGQDLENVLAKHGHATKAFPFLGPGECVDLITQVGADLVFCTTEDSCYRPFLSALRQKGSAVPIIAVSRYPDISQWLDALECGATDYCAPPFESDSIEWILRQAQTRGHSPPAQCVA